MKNTIKYILVFAIAGIIVSCNNSTHEKSVDNNTRTFAELEKAKWLLGEWHNESEEGISAEIWENKNDSTFAGKSCFIVGKDTVSSETITLQQDGKDLFYIPIVKNQNNNQPVKFSLTSSTGKQLVFENPKHDFPQKISYTQITHDSLVAEISGTMEGKYNAQQFPLKRVK